MMPQSTNMPRYVFVYGTLRSGGRNDIARFHPKPERVADARIAGTLYDLGAYPGAVLGGPGEVFGEIYRITPELEAQLDALEEVKPDGSGEYIKREVPVEPDAGGEGLSCLVYEIHPERVRGRRVIAGGDWFGVR
ncbi:gamma-glutamylcyclotransferase family protein [Variovorax sp. J22P240]|uniref:gamma-glutamylcyclotransferase family protein n=1 Tax=unclassified Variovorax TaxID=663243 RepID=UPI0025786C83|nr:MULTISPECIES: gamma-glutamylcyclotransferase family protein [unclassified Variovorax]MDL9997157.1 gamma-glutamylcyclotransferase family protein [Variovorax sp. J22P240]MDM0048206.1 gamma-glutamylcyclotransferase family protein [Variovorax sp. J22R115]